MNSLNTVNSATFINPVVLLIIVVVLFLLFYDLVFEIKRDDKKKEDDDTISNFRKLVSDKKEASCEIFDHFLKIQTKNNRDRLFEILEERPILRRHLMEYLGLNRR